MSAKHICTKDNPRPLGANKKDWDHPDEVETGQSDEGDARYECPHCNCYFYIELED